MTGTGLITLSDEVHHIGVGRREGQELSENRLDLLMGDELAIALVEQTEALFGLFIFA